MCPFSVPGPSLTTVPTPSWPPTWPGWTGAGRIFHDDVMTPKSEWHCLVSRVWCRGGSWAAYDAGVSAVGEMSATCGMQCGGVQGQCDVQVNEQLSRSGLGRVELNDLCADLARLVIDDGLVLLGDLGSRHAVCGVFVGSDFLSGGLWRGGEGEKRRIRQKGRQVASDGASQVLKKSRSAGPSLCPSVVIHCKVMDARGRSALASALRGTGISYVDRGAAAGG